MYKLDVNNNTDNVKKKDTEDKQQTVTPINEKPKKEKEIN
jgi:hypothetical protein